MAVLPLPDMTPEFIAYSNGPMLLAQVAPIYAIAALVVLGRCYVRVLIVKSFRWDDWTMLVCLVFATSCFVAFVIEIHLGVGKHVAVITSDKAQYKQLLKWRLVHMTTVSVGIVLVKVSVCLFLLRLATRGAQVWFLWGVICFLIPFALAGLGTLVFQCNPIAAAWDIDLQPPPMGHGTARCFSGDTFDAIGLFNGIVNISTDFLLALAPVPLVWKLQMPLRTRLTLVAILSLGIFAAVAGIIRQLSSSQFGVPEPYIYDSYSIWNFIELDMGIIAASLPALKPLFSWFRDTARGLTGKPVKSSGYKSAEGYQRRVRPVDEDNFALVEYDQKRAVTVVSKPSERKDKWGIDRARSSEESILPRDERISQVGITVTKSVHVD
ncbi:hypothetical protein BKA63DRAFT_581790 [Paraphoma chrysanthemicola]|nr:hypothetical protein BKA63DRAFT_581790 [Paraphoma chrysanthemicola]